MRRGASGLSAWRGRIAGLVAIAAGVVLLLAADVTSGTHKGRARRRLLPLSGPVAFVSPSGDDASPGSEERPWRTIQKACSAAVPGMTVQIRGGTYRERVVVEVSGSASGGSITFRAFGDERVVLDGGTLTAPEGASALLLVDSRSYLRFEGLEVTGYRSATRDVVPIGILVTGTAHHVEIADCFVHHIESTAPVDRDLAGRDAHAIAVYGTSGSSSIHDLAIVGNEVSHCRLGSSEAVVVNGNVERFEIASNLVHDNDNIGIDVIGHEGTASANDQARDGEIRGNQVWACSAAGNPAYTDLAAAGIYVDGGRDLVIEGNTTHHNDYGIEVGCENRGRTVSGVTVRSNFVYLNKVAGIAFGGYDTDRGVAVDCRFRHNTLCLNDTTGSGSGEIVVQVGHDNVVDENVIVCGASCVMVSNYFTSTWSYATALERNLYYAAGGAASALWVWQDEEYDGFDAFRAATGQDIASAFRDPLFVDATTPDLHLRSSSPAVDAGDQEFVPDPGERDIDGEERVMGRSVDVGADEVTQPVVAASDRDAGLACPTHPRLDPWPTR